MIVFMLKLIAVARSVNYEAVKPYYTINIIQPNHKGLASGCRLFTADCEMLNYLRFTKNKKNPYIAPIAGNGVQLLAISRSRQIRTRISPNLISSIGMDQCRTPPLLKLVVSFLTRSTSARCLRTFKIYIMR